MLQHQKRSIPLWVHEHRGCMAQISSLLRKLQDIPEGNRLPDYLARSIVVNPLDYHTGVTNPSVTPYFGRRFDLALKKKADLTKVYRLFRKADDCFGSEKDTKLCQAVAHEIDVQIGRHYRELEFVNKAPYEWTDLSNGCSSDKSLQIKKAKCSYRIRRPVEVIEPRRNHRMAFLQMANYPDPSKPTVTELQVLLHLMKNGGWERKVFWRQNGKKAAPILKRTHYVVPVLLVTTFFGGQVRVIWGYLDSQKLQVQLSELRQFKSSSLYKDLADVIQWALPTVRGDTTQHIAMPSIAESEEKSEEEDAAEEAAEEEEDTEIEIKEDPSLQTLLSDSQVYEQISRCSTCNSGKRRRSKRREKGKKRRR